MNVISLYKSCNCFLMTVLLVDFQSLIVLFIFSLLLHSSLFLQVSPFSVRKPHLVHGSPSLHHLPSIPTLQLPGIGWGPPCCSKEGTLNPRNYLTGPAQTPVILPTFEVLISYSKVLLPSYKDDGIKNYSLFVSST